jgi:uncharacterized protein
MMKLSVPSFFKNLLGADKHQRIEAGLDEYLEQLHAIAQHMCAAIQAYLGGDREEFLRLFEQINRVENRLDTLRRTIEEEIYRHRLLPDTRDDVLALLEGLDKIPNRMQAVTREMLLQQIRIPEPVLQSVAELAERGSQIVEVLIRATAAFLNRPHEVRRAVKDLSRHEHEGDLIEQRALKLIFEDADLELAEKLQLYTFVDRLGSICDIAEDRGDQIMISALKRLL